MCRRRERASADRRVRSGPACSSAPAEQNEERRRTAPAKQLRQWRSVRNFSPESPPCCIRHWPLYHTSSRRRRSKTKPRRVDEVRSGSNAKGSYRVERVRLPLTADIRADILLRPLRATKRHQAECSSDRTMLMDNPALLKDKPPPSTRLARICAIREVQHEQQNCGGNDLAPEDACNPRGRCSIRHRSASRGANSIGG